MQKVTSKNTKNEILDAYEGLLKEVKDNKANKSEEQKTKASNQLVAKSVAQNRVERPLTEPPSHTTVQALSHTAVSDLCSQKKIKVFFFFSFLLGYSNCNRCIY